MSSVKYAALQGSRKLERVEINIQKRSPSRPTRSFNHKTIFLGLFIAMVVTIIVKVIWLTYNDSTIGRRRSLHFPINETLQLCKEGLEDKRLYIDDQPENSYEGMQKIYFVTATNSRPVQVPLMVRLSHTLKLVPKIHWIVADHHFYCNKYLERLLDKSGLPYTLLGAALEKELLRPDNVVSYRSALMYIRSRKIETGILYFGDDDHIYDLDIFKEIRSTKTISMFPTALAGGLPILGPIVYKQKVITLLHSWLYKNKWTIDISGFAINLNYLAQYPNATFSYSNSDDEGFLHNLHVSYDMIQPLANHCSDILVWKVQSESSRKVYPPFLRPVNGTNLVRLFKNLEDMGIVPFSDEKSWKTQANIRSVAILSNRIVNLIKHEQSKEKIHENENNEEIFFKNLHEKFQYHNLSKEEESNEMATSSLKANPNKDDSEHILKDTLSPDPSVPNGSILKHLNQSSMNKGKLLQQKEKFIKPLIRSKSQIHENLNLDSVEGSSDHHHNPNSEENTKEHSLWNRKHLDTSIISKSSKKTVVAFQKNLDFNPIGLEVGTKNHDQSEPLEFNEKQVSDYSLKQDKSVVTAFDPEKNIEAPLLGTHTRNISKSHNTEYVMQHRHLLVRKKRPVS